MIDKLTKNLTLFYQMSLVAVMIAALSVIFYFWKLGFIDGSRSRDLHKAGFTLERLSEGKGLNEVKGYILKENPKKSLEKIELLENEMESLNKLVEDNKFQESFDELQRLKTGVANLISFPKTSKVLSVFNDKMENFAEYVQRNNWRTLTRMSSRVLSESRDPLSGMKLRKTVKSIEKDFNSMIKITEKSVLSRADKSEINSRISNLKVETEMLNKYLDERDLSISLLGNFQKRFTSWIETISPDLSLQKLQVERMGRYYVMGVLGILGLAGGLFFIGFIFNRWQISRSQNNLEESIKSLISSGIIDGEEFQAEKFSEDFQDYAKRTSNYINKRMSFGSIFQETLPFSSVMLDKNLKVEWTNKQFCMDWEITEDEATQDYMSWDYLSKLTNLGHDDPVIEALKNDVAGIYQIQVRPTEEAETKPYEMFVAPVKREGQKKIMLFFYPLLSMRETIKDQAVSIVNPIDKTLRLFIEDEYATADKKQLRKEYEVGGIEKMLDMFESFHQKREREIKELNDQIEMLNHFIAQTQNSAESAFDINAEAYETAKEQVQHLRSFKDGVISLSDTAKTLESYLGDLSKEFGETLEDLNIFQKDFTSLKNSVEDMSVSLPNLDSLKEEIKAQRSKASEAKSRLGQGLASMIHIKKGISHPEIVKKFQSAYERIYSQFEELDKVQTDLDKKLAQLEINLSKTQMLTTSAQQGVLGLHSYQNFSVIKAKKDKRVQLNSRAGHLQGRAASSEEMIIATLQAFYKGHKENLKRHSDVAKALDLPEGNFANFMESEKQSSSVSETTM